MGLQFSYLPKVYLVNQALPLCFVLTCVYRAGQLKYDFPQLHEKFLPSQSFLVLLFLLSQSLSMLNLSPFCPKLDSLIRANININIINLNQTVAYTMLCFLGVKVNQPITNKQKYKECLQQINHYLCSRPKIQTFESDYVLSVLNQQYTFSIAKNPFYFHTNYYNMPLFDSQDFQFLDTCYECLMIIQQTFPLNIRVELVTDSQSSKIASFQQKKEEQLNRRINNNLRTIVQDGSQLQLNDIQNIIYLISHHYYRKNKQIAIKMLISKVNPYNVSELSQEFVEYIDKLQQQVQLKRFAAELGNKIKAIQNEYSRNNQNNMMKSNVSQQKYGENIKLQPLIFQLKESYNLERICGLLANAINSEQQKDYLVKLQPSINIVTHKFVSNDYQQMSKYATQFGQLLKEFWMKRGKKWQQVTRTAVQSKIKELNSISRTNTNKSRLMTERKLN